MHKTKAVVARASLPCVRGAAIALLISLLVLLATPSASFAAEGDWPSFRPTADNNAVVDAPTPTTAQHTALRWVRTFGSGWSDSPTPPILVNGKLIEITGQVIREVDPATGKTLREKKVLKGTPSFAYTPPTYADGVIYVPLAGIDSGKKDDDGNPILVPGIQAVNAKTLKRLWVYKDSEEGQNWVAPAVKNGLVYAGFYSSDTAEAHFVCLQAKTDGQTKAGTSIWSHSAKGGFYWSNPLIVGSSVIVGTGDGALGDSGKGQVLSLDLKTGKTTSSAEMTEVAGDVHATAVYDATDGYVFVTTTPGWLYRFEVNAKTGALSRRPVRVRVGTHCTTTPVVYDGRVYVGTNSGFAAGQLVCVDASSMEKEYAVDLGGPMQSSPTLSTGHLAQTGKVTLYCTINSPNRGLVAVTVAPHATRAAQAKVAELYDESGHEQYGICSPIVGPDGTLYYKNDSGALFAVGPTDDKVHARVVSLIRDIGTVGKKSGAKIRKARKAYRALSKAQRAAIPNYGMLQRAEARYAQLTKKPKRAAGKRSSSKTGRAASKAAASKTAGLRASATKQSRAVSPSRRGLPAAAQPTSAGGLNPEQNRAAAIGLPAASGGGGGGAPTSTARSYRGAAASSENARQASSKTSARGGASKAKGATKKHTDDPPAATAPLPAAAPSSRIPSWVWLVVLAAAAAALIGLLVYRHRINGRGASDDGR